MKTTRQLSVPREGDGMRLDTWLTRQVRVLSRVHIKRLIYEGQVRINGRKVVGRRKIRVGEKIEIDMPPPIPAELKAQDIPLDILHEDPDIIVINKPPGLVMHPACGHADGTLANALMYRCPDMIIGNEIRPGLVHRLDQNTSGVLVAAKNVRALTILARQFQRRDVRKEYLALVWGRPEPPCGTVETLIGHDAVDFLCMSATPPAGRPAITHYMTEQALGDWTVLRVRIETGRTHQIRVHLAYIGHPVVGDRVYGFSATRDYPAPAARQMLHAHRLRIRHPATNAYQEFTAPLPEDMRMLIAACA